MTQEAVLYVVLAFLISLLIAVFQYYKKEKGFFKEKILFIFLRCITIATILLLLFNPKLHKTTVFVEKPTLVVAIDNSSSISFLEQDKNVQHIKEQLVNSEDLKSRFNIEYTTLGNSFKGSDELNFEEGQTKISEALATLTEVYRNKTAPILLITDGNQTFGEKYTFKSINFPQHVYPVVLGDTISYLDLSISQLNVNKYAYYKNEFPVEIVLNYNGNEKVNTQFEITNGNTIVYKENISFSKENNSKVILTTLPANTIGLQLYKATINPKEEERNKVNNYKEFALEVIDQKSKILVISDIVHPDLGALKKSIESNELRAVTIEKSSINIDELDAYQMVVLYQPTTRFNRIFEAIDKRKLNSFIITGTKTNWRFLNSIQKEFRKESNRQAEDVQGVLNKGYANFVIDDIGFSNYPPLEDFLGDTRIEGTVDIILNQRIRSIETGNPLLFTTESNGIRKAVLLGENMWKWRAQSYLDTNSFKDFDAFFGKLIFYLATNKQRNRLDINFEAFYNGSSAIKISAQYFNKNYEFDANANISIDFKNKETNTSRSIPLLLKNNYYEADLSGIPAGEYDFTIKVQEERLSRSGSFKVLDFDIEKQFLNANITDLTILAKNTGGSLFFPDQFETIRNMLLNNEAYKPIQKSKEDIVPLIQWKYLLALLILSLAAEWFFRKYNGLI